MKIVVFVLIGVAAGILSGLFGIGGGILIIPSLMYFIGFNQLTAQGTSLAIMLPPVGLLAFMEYYKKGNVNVAAGIIICITMFIGAKFGGMIANQLPVEILKKAFAVFLVLVGVKMFFGK
ncbi:MAG: TSUP family transporter [Bacillota bacterium]|nr:TSUP family transporter [Bacillota bacterium]